MNDYEHLVSGIRNLIISAMAIGAVVGAVSVVLVYLITG
jgi:hypothetical protein